MNIEQIRELISVQTAEGQTLEFKSQLPDRSDRGRAEFLKDVSSLANASGGVILFGVTEKAGRAEALSGIHIADPDAEIRRLSQMLESGVEPRLAGVRFETITAPEGDVLLVDVSQSFDAPHRYRFNSHSKFVQRTGTHTSELSYEQLRAAFNRTSLRTDKLRQQWKKQIALDQLWRPLIGGPVCIVRLASIMAADGRQVIDPKEAHKHRSHLIFSGWGSMSSAFNYDGLVVFPGSATDAQSALVQVSRTGAITAYRTARLLTDDRRLIPANVVGGFIIEAARVLREFALLLGLRGSAVLNVGLLRLTSFKLATTDEIGFAEEQDTTVDSIQMPEFWIESIEGAADLDSLLRPGFDLMWQSFGSPECPLFNEEGRWSPR